MQGEEEQIVGTLFKLVKVTYYQYKKFKSYEIGAKEQFRAKTD